MIFGVLVHPLHAYAHEHIRCAYDAACGILSDNMRYTEMAKMNLVVLCFIDNLLYTTAEQKSIRPYIACDIVDMHYIIYVYASL